MCSALVREKIKNKKLETDFSTRCRASVAISEGGEALPRGLMVAASNRSAGFTPAHKSQLTLPRYLRRTTKPPKKY